MEENNVMVTNEVVETGVAVPEVVNNEESKNSIGTTLAVVAGGGLAVVGAVTVCKWGYKKVKKGLNFVKTKVGSAFSNDDKVEVAEDVDFEMEE